jgi:hypothetical protein
MSATARVVEFKIQFGQSRQGIPSLLNVIATTTPMVQTICHGTCDIDKYNIFTENIHRTRSGRGLRVRLDR